MSFSTLSHRPDGRSPSQIRPLVADFGLLHAADGSARFAHGDTKVLVGVHGPRPPRGPRFENPERAVLDIKVVPASGGMGGAAEADLEAALRSVLESVVVLAAHPRTVVSITVQVLNDAGSLLPCAINAAVLALSDASVPLFGLVAAVSVGQPAAAPSSHSSQACLDLLSIEEGFSPAELLRSAAAGAGGVASSSSSSRPAAMAGWGVFAFGGKQLLGGEGDDDEAAEDESEDESNKATPAAPGDAVAVCVFTRLVGALPGGFDAAAAVEEAARGGAAAVLAFMRLALRRKVSKDAVAMGLGGRQLA